MKSENEICPLCNQPQIYPDDFSNLCMKSNEGICHPEKHVCKDCEKAIKEGKIRGKIIGNCVSPE